MIWWGIKKGGDMINPISIQPPVAGSPAVGKKNQERQKSGRTPLKELAQAGVKKRPKEEPSPQEQPKQAPPRDDVPRISPRDDVPRIDVLI